MRKSIAAVVAALAIPFSVATLARPAQADIPAATVANIGRAVIAEANKLYRDAYRIIQNANKADVAADAARQEALNVRAQARALHHQGLYLLRDDKYFLSYELCREARSQMAQAENDEIAGAAHRRFQRSAEAAAAHHRQEATDLKAALALETDATNKANIQKLITGALRAADAADAEARRQAGLAQGFENAVGPLDRAWQEKQRKANEIVPNSCIVKDT